MTVFFFSLALYLKTELVRIKENQQGERRLLESLEGRSLASAGDQVFSEKNIRFTESNEVDLASMNYTEFINPFKKNLNKI